MTQILLDLANRSPAPRDAAAPVVGPDDRGFAERLQDAASESAPEATEATEATAAAVPAGAQEQPTDQESAGEPAPTVDEAVAEEPVPQQELEPIDEPDAIELSAVDVIAITTPEQVEVFDAAPLDIVTEPVAADAAEAIVVDSAASSVVDPAAGAESLGDGGEGPDDAGPIAPVPLESEGGAEDQQPPAETAFEQVAPTEGENAVGEGEFADSPATIQAGVSQQADRQASRSVDSSGFVTGGSVVEAADQTDEASQAGGEPPGGGVAAETGDAAVASTSVAAAVAAGGSAAGDAAEVVEPAAEAAEGNPPVRVDAAPTAPEPTSSGGEADLSRIAAGRIGQPNQTEAGDEAGPRIDAARFVSRVSGAFRAAEERGGEVRLRLSPPELGVLQIKLTVSEGVLSASLETENATARNAILDNLPALRERLAEQEIRIEKFDVDVRDEGSGGDAQDFSPGERRDRQDRDRAPSTEGGPARGREATADANQPRSTIGEGRINVVA